MKTINNPKEDKWDALSTRPSIDKSELIASVRNILDDVKSLGDQALINYTQAFDGVEIESLKVELDEIKKSCHRISDQLKKAIQTAYTNISKFHLAQQIIEPIIETTRGVKCWRKSVPIEKVGLYIPGGSAPLFSTILMLGIPAKIAGCKEVVLCCPPNKKGKLDPVILYTASLVGIKNIYTVGGAQAIGAMAYGTESIPKVYKIFGPGNQYVTMAKEMVVEEKTSIDIPAGPSELLVVADESARPEFLAADLLSQAEHGPDSQVVLLSNNAETISKTLVEIENQLNQLPRKNIAIKSLNNSKAILFSEISDCAKFSNLYAPEHLIIATKDSDKFSDEFTNAGSIFLGNYSCESAGDYASGTNHTLPTNGFAKNYSGVSLDSFVKKITYQKISKEGLMNIGPVIEAMAEAEGLYAHKNAVSIRLKD